VVLAAGVFGLLPPLLATTLAVAVGGCVYGANLLWAAGRQPTGSAAIRWAVSLLGAAVLGVAATAALSMAGSDQQNLVTRTGLFACTGLFLLALPLLPGDHGGRNWLNRTVNGLILGTAGLLALWLLWLPAGGHDRRIVAVLLVTGLATPVLLFSALTAGYRTGGAACHLGAALCVLGLGDFALAAENVLAAVPVAAGFMIFGPVLIWYGAGNFTGAPRPTPPSPTRPARLLRRLAMHLAPVLVVGLAVVVAVHRGDRPSGIALLLGPVLLGLLAVREWLGHLAGHIDDAHTRLLPGPASRRRLLSVLKARLVRPGRGGALLLVGIPRRADRDAPASLADARVAASAGTGGLVARVDDSTFLVLVDGGPMRAGAVAATLAGTLAEEYPGRTGRPVSIGLAELVDGASPQGVLDRARIAQHRAARLGTGVEWFDAEVAAAEARHQVICRELPGALARDEFTLLYRPVVDLTTDRPVGAQPTVQWRSRALGSVPATEFLPAAGDGGEMTGLGEWILTGSFRQLSRWLADGLDLWMMLRIVGPYLFHPRLVTGIEGALRHNAVAGGRLVLETTEDAVADDQPAAADQLTRLRHLGARSCLTATGRSGLPMAQLRRLPVDVVKISTALAPSVTQNVGSLALAGQLARRYGVDLLVDGVGTPDELARVRAAGCRLVSGPLFGAPMAAERFEALLRDFRTPVEPR
jgi:EAL domain-containing protein (putative c-di-GMP-specific phosphodiesterase class I)